MRAKVLRFYSMSPSAYAKLNVKYRDELWEAITVIEAQQFLMQMQLAIVPNMKRDAREKLHKTYAKMAFPRDLGEKRSVTMEEIQRRLAKVRV